MIIGNGLIANAFQQYKNCSDIIIFASGVSNSKETNADAYLRERNLLQQILKENLSDALVVYFGTTSINDPDLSQGQYCQHKLMMEELVKKSSKTYLIFRLAEVVGKSSNPCLIFNYIVDAVVGNKPFNVWKNAGRHFMDIDHVGLLCSRIIDEKFFFNTTINISSPMLTKIIDLVHMIEEVFNKKSNYKLVDKGTCYRIDLSDIQEILAENQIIFDDKYVINLISKYHNI